MQSEITGTIEVILEDKRGTRKYYEKTHNKLTNAALFHLLCGGLSGTPFMRQVLRTGKEQGQGQQNALNDGGVRVYCLSHDIQIHAKTILRPYLDTTQRTLKQQNAFDSSVISFMFDKIGDAFETTPATAENDGQELVPYVKNCAFLEDDQIVRYSFEYRNISGSGQVNSVILGQGIEDTETIPIGIRLSPRVNNMPTAAYPDGKYCIQHHHRNGAPVSWIWKSTDVETRLGIYDVTCSSYKPSPSGSANFINETPDPEVTMSGGLLMRTDTDELTPHYVLAKAYLKGTTDETTAAEWNVLEGNGTTSKVFCLALIQDATISPNPIVIEKTFNAPDGFSMPLEGSPVLVQEEDGSLGIFFTGEQCVNENDETVDLYALYKWSLPAFALNTGTDAAGIAWGDAKKVGEIPFIVGSCFHSTADTQYLLGYYDKNKNEYYLPAAAIVKNTQVSKFGSDKTVFGIRVRPFYRSADIPSILTQDIMGYELCACDVTVKDAEDGVGAEITEYGITQWVAGKNTVQQVICCGKDHRRSLWTVIQDTVWSGANLQNPIVKDHDDVLRVIYSYELGNAKTAVGTITHTCGCCD